MKPQTLKYIYVGETKNRFKYDQEKVEGQTLVVVGSLYVSKTEATEPPKELIVTVTPVTA